MGAAFWSSEDDRFFFFSSCHWLDYCLASSSVKCMLHASCVSPSNKMTFTHFGPVTESVPVFGKPILLAEATRDTSFSGRTWCIVSVILCLLTPLPLAPPHSSLFRSISLPGCLWRDSFHFPTSVEKGTAEVSQSAEWGDCVDDASFSLFQPFLSATNTSSFLSSHPPSISI